MCAYVLANVRALWSLSFRSCPTLSQMRYIFVQVIIIGNAPFPPTTTTMFVRHYFQIISHYISSPLLKHIYNFSLGSCVVQWSISIFPFYSVSLIVQYELIQNIQKLIFLIMAKKILLVAKSSHHIFRLLITLLHFINQLLASSLPTAPLAIIVHCVQPFSFGY